MRKAPTLRPPSRPLRIGIAIAAVFACAGAFAQSDKERIAELERRLDQTVQQLQQLQQSLQRAPQVGATAAAQPASPDLAAKVQQLERDVAASANRRDEDRGLAVHGFADVGLAAGSKERNVGGNIGSLDLYLTPTFGDRVKTLFELNFEVSPQGSVLGDLERLQVGYIVSDELTLWAGRYHTPLGYWNTAFHHGAQIQTSIKRPLFLEFEDLGGILPAHTVGLWATGGVKLGGGRLNYDLYAGNAPTIAVADASITGTGTLDIGLNGARNRSATVGANLSYAFNGALDGLTLGAHALTSKVADSLDIPNQTRLGIYGGWLTYLKDDWEIAGELYEFRNRDLSGSSGTHTSHAGYLQAGRTFGTITPFARFERTSLDQRDNYFAQLESGHSYKRIALGVRYDMNPSTALKLEAHRTSFTDRITDSYSEVRAQWAVRF